MMCRVVNILLFSLLILMVFSSCEHRELVDPQNTHYVRVYLDEQIRNVTFGFYNETYERPEYVRPSVLRAVLADPQSGKIVNERILRNHGKDERGHYIDGYIVASAGTYNFMVYELGSAVTLVREANNFYQMQAYTNPISERYLQYIPTIRKEIDEDNIMNSPDHMFHEVCQGVTIKNSTEIDTLFNLQGDFFTAQSLASSYYIQIKVKGIEWITTAVSLMKGVAGSKYLCNKGELVSSDSVHVFFGMNYIDKKRIAGEDISQATLYATFSTFGMIQDATTEYILSIEFTKIDGSTQVEKIDITKLFEDPIVKENQWILLDHEVMIEQPEGSIPTGGMKPGVNEWNDIEAEIEM